MIWTKSPKTRYFKNVDFKTSLAIGEEYVGFVLYYDINIKLTRKLGQQMES